MIAKLIAILAVTLWLGNPAEPCNFADEPPIPAPVHAAFLACDSFGCAPALKINCGLDGGGAACDCYVQLCSSACGCPENKICWSYVYYPTGCPVNGYTDWRRCYCKDVPPV